MQFSPGQPPLRRLVALALLCGASVLSAGNPPERWTTETILPYHVTGTIHETFGAHDGVISAPWWTRNWPPAEWGSEGNAVWKNEDGKILAQAQYRKRLPWSGTTLEYSGMENKPVGIQTWKEGHLVDSVVPDWCQAKEKFDYYVVPHELAPIGKLPDEKPSEDRKVLQEDRLDRFAIQNHVQECYRLIVCPSFSPLWSIRLMPGHDKRDGAQVDCKITNGDPTAGDVTKLVFDERLPVSADQWRGLLKDIEATRLWSNVREFQMPGLDGETSIFEGVRDGKYFRRSYWCCNIKSILKLKADFLALAPQRFFEAKIKAYLDERSKLNGTPTKAQAPDLFARLPDASPGSHQPLGLPTVHFPKWGIEARGAGLYYSEAQRERPCAQDAEWMDADGKTIARMTYKDGVYDGVLLRWIPPPSAHPREDNADHALGLSLETWQKGQLIQSIVPAWALSRAKEKEIWCVPRVAVSLEGDASQVSSQIHSPSMQQRDEALHLLGDPDLVTWAKDRKCTTCYRLLELPRVGSALSIIVQISNDGKARLTARAWQSDATRSSGVKLATATESKISDESWKIVKDRVDKTLFWSSEEEAQARFEDGGPFDIPQFDAKGCPVIVPQCRHVDLIFEGIEDGKYACRIYQSPMMAPIQEWRGAFRKLLPKEMVSKLRELGRVR